MNIQTMPLWQKILLGVLIIIVGCSLIKILGTLLWLAVKILLPIALIVWLVRVISGRNGRYY